MRRRLLVSSFLRATVTAVLVATAGQSLVSAQSVRATQSGLAATSWTAPRTPDGQPDLEGVWADLSMTPLERPKALAGRTSLTEEEVARLKERAERFYSDATNDFIPGDNLFLTLLADLPFGRNPNATGNATGLVRRHIENRTSLITDPADGRLPAVTDEGRRRQAAGQAATLGIAWQPGVEPVSTERRIPTGPEQMSNWLRCITWGVPKIAGNFNYLSHYQIVQGPGYVVLLSEVNHEARIIPIDARPHLPQTIAQWNGDSRGTWEGHTLVVETRNFSSRSYFMGAADGLRLTERFTRISPDTINYEITVSDPATWTRPWTALVRLTRTNERIYESGCHEGNYTVIEGILGARAD